MPYVRGNYSTNGRRFGGGYNLHFKIKKVEGLIRQKPDNTKPTNKKVAGQANLGVNVNYCKRPALFSLI